MCKELLKHIKNLFKTQGWAFVLFMLVQLSVLWRYHVYIKDFFAILVLLFFFRKYVDKASLFIGLFSMFYTMIWLLSGASSSMFESLSYMICPMAYYIFGKRCVLRGASTDDIVLFILCTILTSSLFLYVLTVKDIAMYGLVTGDRSFAILENTTENGGLAATLYGMVASFGIAGLAYPVLYGLRNNIKSWLFLLCGVCSLLVVLHLVNRTGLVLLALVLILSILYRTQAQPSTIIVTLLCVGVVYILLHSIGIMNTELFDAYATREENSEYGAATAGGRIERWLWALEHLCSHPFGWYFDYSNQEYHYAHNLWLDVARCTGIIPFLLLVSITIRQLATTIKLYRIKSNPFGGFIITMMIIFLLQAGVEPTMEGMSTYFYLICMLWGIQTAYFHQMGEME